MLKNPYINSILASLYIVFIVSVISIITRYEVNSGVSQYAIPVIMLSLFTLSASVMFYLFFLEPIMLFLDNKKKECIKYFLSTVLGFGFITLLILLGYFLII